MAVTASAAGREPVPISVGLAADDVLSQRVAAAIEERLRASDRFVLVPAASAGSALRMTIPGNVHWEPVGNRTRVRFSLEFRRGDEGEPFGFFEGTCWETQLAVCARQALFAATSALEAN